MTSNKVLLDALIRIESSHILRKDEKDYLTAFALRRSGDADVPIPPRPDTSRVSMWEWQIDAGAALREMQEVA